LGETIRIRKTTHELLFIPAAEWVRRLAQETAAFKVEKVSEAKRVRDDKRGTVWDYDITITIPNQAAPRRVHLLVETRTQLTPQLALAAVQRMKLLAQDGQPLLCVPYIPPRVAEICREQQVSYLDGAGNCRLAVPGLFVYVSGRPSRPTPIKAAVDPFSPKSSRIVRAVLTDPDNGWQVQELAEKADVSIGLVSKVKKTLLEDAYLEERDRRLYVRDPASLLNEWASRYRPRVRPVHLFAIPRPLEVEERIAGWCAEDGTAYALTQLSAAWRYSPMVRYDKSVAYIDSGITAEGKLSLLLEHLDAREVDTGANCTLWITDDPAVFADAREFDVTVVSPLQLYLDLKILPGRGEEAAQEILEKELRGLLPASRRERDRASGGKNE
jgi:Transcriptional regulator, AbiEi antitoxin, Type IV TA system